MTLLLTNLATSTLAAGISAGALTLTVATGEGAKFPRPIGAGEWFPLVLVSGTGQFEIVRCTARFGDTLTIQRAQEGTTARSFLAGDRVDLRLTAGALATKFDKSDVTPFWVPRLLRDANAEDARAGLELSPGLQNPSTYAAGTLETADQTLGFGSYLVGADTEDIPLPVAGVLTVDPRWSTQTLQTYTTLTSPYRTFFSWRFQGGGRTTWREVWTTENFNPDTKFSSIRTLVYSSSTTYTPDPRARYWEFELIGGGGGGGGSSSVAGSADGGGGGASGGETLHFMSLSGPAGPFTISIGAGGAAGIGGAGNGGQGGTTSVSYGGSTIATAAGGPGGLSLSAGSRGGAGASTSGTGAIRFPGKPGSNGYYRLTAQGGFGGTGGSSKYGRGGRGLLTNTAATPTGEGGEIGSGGGGGATYNQSSAQANGGPGGSGLVLIREYLV